MAEHTEEEIEAASEQSREEFKGGFEGFLQSLAKDRTKGVMRLSLNDAATNCQRDGAVATVTLRSGVQFEGKLEKPSSAYENTAHMKFDDGGWTTIDHDEIAAVGVRPAPRHRGY